jgi:hypothetical protein
MEFSQMLKFALAAAVALGLSSAAVAQGPIKATLNTAVAKPTDIQANDTTWSCSEKSCVVKAMGEETDTWLECRKFAQKAGKVVAYGSLNENQLAMCNAGMK